MPNRLPRIVNVYSISPVHARLTLSIEPDLDYFIGHFPEAPVLPGVVQVHWAEHYGREHLDSVPPRETFRSLEAIKFQALIRPPREVSLELKYLTNKQKLSFSYFSGDIQYSSGRIVFGHEKEGA